MNIGIYLRLFFRLDILLYHNHMVIPNTDVSGIPIIRVKREIRLSQKRSYKYKKSFIDFCA